MNLTKRIEITEPRFNISTPAICLPQESHKENWNNSRDFQPRRNHSLKNLTKRIEIKFIMKLQHLQDNLRNLTKRIEISINKFTFTFSFFSESHKENWNQARFSTHIPQQTEYESHKENWNASFTDAETTSYSPVNLTKRIEIISSSMFLREDWILESHKENWNQSGYMPVHGIITNKNLTKRIEILKAHFLRVQNWNKNCESHKENWNFS